MPICFVPSQFVPTKFSTAEDKATFANKLIRFLENDCPQSQFTKKLYQRLSNCFQHIAEYDDAGFYDTWFSSPVQKLAFLKNLLRFPCYGDPQWTFSDVERALQVAIGGTTLLEQYQLRSSAFVDEKELALLAVLQARHPDARFSPREETAAFPLVTEVPVMQESLFG
jgi:hypothetical protein